MKYKKNNEKVREKNDVKVEVAKIRTKTFFVICHHALQSELNKVSISNFNKFRLQSLSSKIERAFEKMT